MPEPKKKDEQVLVQFAKLWGGYNAGDRATFSKEKAAELIAACVVTEPGLLEKVVEKAKELADRKVSKAKTAKPKASTMKVADQKASTKKTTDRKASRGRRRPVGAAGHR
jgi:hypothetical protein